MKSSWKKFFRPCLCGITFSLLLAGGCSTLPQNIPRPSSTAIATNNNTILGESFADLEQAHPQKSGYYLLADGVDAFVARLLLTEAARQTLDIQYYIFRLDIAGKMFCKKLLEAAERGVRIRLLLDDMEIESNDFTFAVLAAHPNIQVRFFNPFAGRSHLGRWWSMLVDLERVNQRMHNKIFVVDNQVAVMGGRNIADAYFSVEPNQYFADLDLLALGPIVREGSESFDAFWNSELSFPVQSLVDHKPNSKDLLQLETKLANHWTRHETHEYRERLHQSDFKEKISSNNLDLTWASGRLVYDRPEQITAEEENIDRLTLLGAYLEPYFENTTDEFLLISPYLIPGDKGMTLFRQLREREVELKILTNSLAATDMSAVYGAYADYRKTLLKMGIDLFELKPSANMANPERDQVSSVGATLHAKTMLLDSTNVFVGTMNFDPRSVYLNTELGLIVKSRQLTAEVRKVFERLTSLDASLRLSLSEQGDLLWRTREQGREVVYEHMPNVSLWDRFKTNLMELLLPNSWL